MSRLAQFSQPADFKTGLISMIKRLGILTLGLTGIIAGVLGAAFIDPYQSGIDWKEPPVVDPGGPHEPPSDAIVLFGGEDLSAWKGGDKWKIVDGVAIPAGGGITSKQAFGDIQLHVEFATPKDVSGKGQGRGNSGVYLMGKYEVQVLDSYKNETYYDGQAAAIYKQWPPLVNASRPPGKWQTYDIIFTAPRFGEDGKLQSPAYVTVLHNGVLVQNHTKLKGATYYAKPPSYEAHPDKLPLHIQFHGNPVHFRNIWVRELEPRKKGESESKEKSAAKKGGDS